MQDQLTECKPVLCSVKCTQFGSIYKCKHIWHNLGISEWNKIIHFIPEFKIVLTLFGIGWGREMSAPYNFVRVRISLTHITLFSLLYYVIKAGFILFVFWDNLNPYGKDAVLLSFIYP